MSKDRDVSLGCRIFVPYDEKTDLGFRVRLVDDKGIIHRCDFEVMVHKESNGEGVILWFDLREFK